MAALDPVKVIVQNLTAADVCVVFISYMYIFMYVHVYTSKWPDLVYIPIIYT